MTKGILFRVSTDSSSLYSVMRKIPLRIAIYFQADNGEAAAPLLPRVPCFLLHYLSNGGGIVAVAAVAVANVVVVAVVVAVAAVAVANLVVVAGGGGGGVAVAAVDVAFALDPRLQLHQCLKANGIHPRFLVS